VRQQPHPFDDAGVGAARGAGSACRCGAVSAVNAVSSAVPVAEPGGRAQREGGLDPVVGGGGGRQGDDGHRARQQRGGPVGRPEVDAHEGVGSAGGRVEGGEHPRQAGGAVPREDHRDDVRARGRPAATGRHRARCDELREGGGRLLDEVDGHDLASASRTRSQTARFFTRRRSRSDRPPQMPKRSSFSSA
jgi:hypothetical protein